MGTGELRRIHSRVAWMFLPVERSMTVSAPHLVAQRIFSTSSSMLDATALLPMLALTFTRKLRPMIIGPDDRAPRRNFGADEFGGQLGGDTLEEAAEDGGTKIPAL